MIDKFSTGVGDNFKAALGVAVADTGDRVYGTRSSSSLMLKTPGGLVKRMYTAPDPANSFTARPFHSNPFLLQ